MIQKKQNFTEYQETLPLGKQHIIRYANNYAADYKPREWLVPEGKYLMLGDNRDNSADGRAFGYLDDSLIIGKANRIAFNFDCLKGDGKCDRFFKKIQ
ncbi:MAG: signal peptidase I [Gammaproteobacteria bacterium]|nr:MAG: signal peptidase I [Gammaproteobacteria bacterium]